MHKAESSSTFVLNISPAMPLSDRLTVVTRLGYAPSMCQALAVQDRASSMLQLMAELVRQGSNQQLIDNANAIIDKWNAECSAMFDTHLPS